MDCTSARLARLTHAHAAHELSERLVAVTSTYADAYGRGAFHTEEAAQVLSDAQALLAAAVVADRVRGCSWTEVGEALGVSKQSAHERFAGSEREFREAILFPDRQAAPEMPGYTVAPYAVQSPDQGPRAARPLGDRAPVKQRPRARRARAGHPRTGRDARQLGDRSDGGGARPQPGADRPHTPPTTSPTSRHVTGTPSSRCSCMSG